MSAGPSGRSPLTGFVACAAAVAVSAALLGFDLGAHVLTTNDEARFPVMARDILAKGHWLLPETSGAPMLNKPPLHAWLIALGAWPTGIVSQRVAVVPSFVAALGVVATTCLIARRLFGPGVDLAAGLIVATTAGVFAMSRSPVPDMTLSFGLVAALAAFVAAELDGRRKAWLAFYGLVGVACWAKGPAGLLPIAIALAYEVATFGARGAARMRLGTGTVIVLALVAPWWLIAADAGRSQFFQDVVRADLMQGYNPVRALAWRRIVEPLGSAASILFPWSLALPFSLLWAARRWRTESAAGERLVLVWALTVFIVVAVSSRQRWRYYLPLCVPGALLAAAWLGTRPVWRGRYTLAACAVATAILAAGEVYLTARDNRRTEFQSLARALDRTPAPVFALEAPELVFSFYLDRPVPAISSLAELRGVDGPAYLIARDPPAGDSFDRVAETVLRGRRFVLWAKR